MLKLVKTDNKDVRVRIDKEKDIAYIWNIQKKTESKRKVHWFCDDNRGDFWLQYHKQIISGHY